jgi:hypothetical protein
MKARCIKVYGQKGSSVIFTSVKNSEKSGSIGSGCYFKNLNYGKGLITYSTELLLKVKVNGDEAFISIDKKFRKRFLKPGKIYANLTEARIRRIKDTIPFEVEVKKTGDSRNPYEVVDQDIDSWFLRI